MTETGRGKVVGRIADHLATRRPGHPLRVAVDGITASGKSSLARELATALRTRGRSAIQLSMNGFHNRRQQGRYSAIGYYQDAYDFESFGRLVLEPLGPGGDGRYRTTIIDLANDEPVDEAPMQASPDAVVIVDGTFLQRSELTGLWDEVVFVDTSFDAARIRGSRPHVTSTELAAADLYEVEDYRRKLVRLSSGIDAWVYLAAGSAVISRSAPTISR